MLCSFHEEVSHPQCTSRPRYWPVIRPGCFCVSSRSARNLGARYRDAAVAASSFIVTHIVVATAPLLIVRAATKRRNRSAPSAPTSSRQQHHCSLSTPRRSAGIVLRLRRRGAPSHLMGVLINRHPRGNPRGANFEQTYLGRVVVTRAKTSSKCSLGALVLPLTSTHF
jgi:hypothetical protein